VAETQTVTVLDAVRETVPRLRANGLQSEERRWIADENIALLDKADVFRAGVPRRFGGLDLDLAEHVAVLLEISRGCGSTGWVCEAWITGAWMVRRFPEQAQQDVYAGGSVKVSGGFTPSGSLVPAEDGYVLNGTWRFNTGCRDADWNLAATILQSADGTARPVMVAVPMREFTLADDWHAMAAAGTGSSTSTAKDVLVPAHRVVDMAEAIEGVRPGDDPGRDYGLVPVVMIESAATLVGMARGAYEMFVERVPGRAISYTAWEDQAQHPLTQIQVAEAANRVAAAEALLYGLVGLVQSRADARQPLTLAEKATVRGQCGFAVQLAKQATEIAYGASGASAIMRSVPIQRFYRDVQGISMHAMMSPAANLELQGRVILGLEPNTPFL
jgi:3-hydroxy-9,10-secoandrosta-1,3,5(10)-triene-9,17-dione monooxygenase